MERKRKKINVGIEHWSKTSCMEPQPVGKHKKSNNSESERSPLVIGDSRFRNKFRANVVCSVSGSSRQHQILASKGSTSAEEKETCARKTEHGGEAVKTWIDDGKFPEFTKKSLSPLQDVTNTESCKVESCLNPKPILEQKGTNEDVENERMVVRKSENVAAASKASTSGQRLEDKDKWIRDRRRVQSILGAFREYHDILLEEHEKNRGCKRVDFEAANWVRRKYLLPAKAVLGPIPGVEVCDRDNVEGEEFKRKLGFQVQIGENARTTKSISSENSQSLVEVARWVPAFSTEACSARSRLNLNINGTYIMNACI
ncbi:OLC1v1031491C1 [Oldenlandia corymbosa var. corymbosa]|uniref:OLC1v1031491C1 n=1 Tax=Oldenlandia corymbosa var. corymbosa TaxID=529605 RepID=A0AAV1CIN3_OLDCO|nr:OLC1v1031491C1 [Oldenlandia corymbosa var. corymbosa]